MRRLLPALVLPVALAACAQLPTTGTPARLAGTSWKATAFPGASAVPAGQGYTLAFGTDGRVNGVGDCNRYFGPFTVTASGGLTFGPLGSTRMGCPNGAMESAFLQGLGAVRTYTVEGRTLTLRTDAGAALTFTRQ